MLGVGEPEVNALRPEQIAEPVPGGRGLDHRALRARPAGQAGEVRGDHLAPGGQLHVAHRAALGVDGADGERPPV
jgi:hypothetical protein